MAVRTTRHPHRVWFPEMVDELKLRWKPSMTWAEVIKLCGELMEMRSKIRKKLEITSKLGSCPDCGEAMDVPGVAVRGVLYILKGEEVIDDETFNELDRSWKRYKRQNNLDGWGVDKSTRTYVGFGKKTRSTGVNRGA